MMGFMFSIQQFKSRDVALVDSLVLTTSVESLGEETDRCRQNLTDFDISEWSRLFC